MKLFTPKHTGGTARIGKAKLSSHIAKPARFASSKVSIKAPKIGTKRSVGKVKI